MYAESSISESTPIKANGLEVRQCAFNSFLYLQTKGTTNSPVKDSIILKMELFGDVVRCAMLLTILRVHIRSIFHFSLEKIIF